MALKKCLGCNVMVDASENKEYCDNCAMVVFNTYSADKQEEVYFKVREYLFDHPRTPKATVADAMNISVRVIDKWIKEGKIEEVGGFMGAIMQQAASVCSNCGKKIPNGLLCDHCKKSFAEEQPTETVAVGFRSKVVTR